MTLRVEGTGSDERVEYLGGSEPFGLVRGTLINSSRRHVAGALINFDCFKGYALSKIPNSNPAISIWEDDYEEQGPCRIFASGTFRVGPRHERQWDHRSRNHLQDWLRLSDPEQPILCGCAGRFGPGGQGLRGNSHPCQRRQ